MTDNNDSKSYHNEASRAFLALGCMFASPFAHLLGSRKKKPPPRDSTKQTVPHLGVLDGAVSISNSQSQRPGDDGITDSPCPSVRSAKLPEHSSRKPG